MDNGACNVIYLDKRAVDEHVRRNNLSESWAVRSNSITGSGNESPGYFTTIRPKNPTEVLSNVEIILSTFNEVHVCNTGASCLTKLSDLHDNAVELVPTILLIDIPLDEERRLKRLSREPRSPSPSSTRRPGHDNVEPDDLYGIHLLQHVASEIQQKSLSRMVVPIAMLSGVETETERPEAPTRTPSGSQLLTEGVRSFRYIDAGAVDVYTSPLSKDHVQGLAVHAYRTRKEVSKEDTSFLMARRNRKVSWVGVDDTKPYAYLREAMVSGLMGGICNPETIGDTIDPNDIEVQPERISVIAKMIGEWEFSAHDFTDDELLYGALLILQHALSMPELEQWRMDSDELTILLLASRTAYNEFVLYHNFRHVVDVLQALFYFLVQIGTLPPYPPGSGKPRKSPQPALAALLKPFDALTLLVSAIGHDVGHPGVNNAFLVALNSPLAQLYNDRSVLESFHCAAYSQILRRYWPGAFSDVGMRKLMINSILATDMGLHFKYMTDIGNLQTQLAHNNNTLDGWNPKVLEEYKELLCGLLIKCADISNVARKFDTAANWARILTNEFSNQGDMEQELAMPTCLFGGPPVLDSVIKMGESQIGFMNIFARPLFEAVSDVLPAMQFSLDEMLRNKLIWEQKIDQERDNQTKRAAAGTLNPRTSYDAAPSPFSEIQNTGDAKKQHQPEPNTPTRLLSGNPTFQLNAAAASTRRSSVGVVSLSEKGSRRSSKQFQSSDNSTSRRGSADASITAILVTQPSPEKQKTAAQQDARPGSPGRKSRAAKTDSRKPGPGEETDMLRPVSAPAPINTKIAPSSRDLASIPTLASSTTPHTGHSSQIHTVSTSEADLSQSANGSLHPRSPQHWERVSSPSQGSAWSGDRVDRTWSGATSTRLNTGSQKWKSGGWRDNQTKPGSVSTHQEAGGYLSAVNPSTSGTSPQGRRKDKGFGLGKIWKKFKSNGDRGQMESRSYNSYEKPNATSRGVSIDDQDGQ